MSLNYDVEAIFEFIGFRKNNVYQGYRPAHLISENYLTTGVHHYYNLNDDCYESLKGTITFISPEAYPESMYIGKKLIMYEGGNVIGYATITSINNPILRRSKN